MAGAVFFFFESSTLWAYYGFLFAHIFKGENLAISLKF